MDFSNLRHLACSEVRAANLSRQCAFDAFNSRLAGGAHRQCVRRRAMRYIQNDVIPFFPFFRI